MWRLGVQCEKLVRDPADSQRPRRRTLRPGQAAWEWKPELPAALQRVKQPKQWRWEEEQWESIP